MGGWKSSAARRLAQYYSSNDCLLPLLARDSASRSRMQIQQELCIWACPRSSVPQVLLTWREVRLFTRDALRLSSRRAPCGPGVGRPCCGYVPGDRRPHEGPAGGSGSPPRGAGAPRPASGRCRQTGRPASPSHHGATVLVPGHDADAVPVAVCHPGCRPGPDALPRNCVPRPGRGRLSGGRGHRAPRVARRERAMWEEARRPGPR